MYVETSDLISLIISMEKRNIQLYVKFIEEFIAS